MLILQKKRIGVGILDILGREPVCRVIVHERLLRFELQFENLSAPEMIGRSFVRHLVLFRQDAVEDLTRALKVSCLQGFER